MIDWETIFRELNLLKESSELPSVSLIGEESNSPYKILVSTIISLRTRDYVTLNSSRRLFEMAPDFQTLDIMTEEEIASLIYPCGFYKVKSANLKKIARILLNQYEGKVPSTPEALLGLPGVGLKTANLTLSLGFAIPAVCVDTHVHRIANRMGWIDTKKPDDSVRALEEVLPRESWIAINELLVLYGQKICTPQSPRCSECSLSRYCQKRGVSKFR
ncbi:MAG: endonuclease III [Spirochaetaceae bacterium 4572_59]|nr:MAG: endonuclease III [Spirochaetaceae bacterium 4572_59]